MSFKIESLFGVAGKVVLVTGGSRGIGLMIARGFAENGARVYISARNREACEETAAELSKAGECYAIAADLSTDEGRRALVSAISQREEQLHILVNNAGASWGAPFHSYPEDGFDKVMSINLRAPFLLTRDLLPLLGKAGSKSDPARIINVGSIDGLRVSDVKNFAYGPSKAALHHLTRMLAVELGGQGITVNAIAPGPFESKMTEWLLEQYRGEYEKFCPLGRIGTPEDMAGVAIYLSSRAGAYVNGAVIPVDGGICIR